MVSFVADREVADLPTERAVFKLNTTKINHVT